MEHHLCKHKSNRPTAELYIVKGGAYLHFCSFLGMAVEALGLDGLEALGLLLMSKQQAAHLGHPLAPLLCLLHCQCLHISGVATSSIELLGPNNVLVLVL